MNIFHFNKVVTLTSTILLLNSSLHALLELNITPYRQWGNNTCWAACSYMVLNAYQASGIGTDEMNIRRFAFPPNGPDVTNQLFGTAISVDEIIYYYGFINSNPTDFNPVTQGGNISQNDLTSEIFVGRPIFCGRLIYDGTATGRKHMLVITGYTGSGGSNAGNVVYNDPATGSRSVQSYAEFVRRGNEYIWYQTLRLTTNPRVPIPTGFYDWVRISNGGTTTVTPSTTSLTYTAGFNSNEQPPAYPVLWNWKLKFVHSGGECIVRSWTSNSTSYQSTWNISNFSLPAGYQWL